MVYPFALLAEQVIEVPIASEAGKEVENEEMYVLMAKCRALGVI